jgi:hypothetical protein
MSHIVLIGDSILDNAAYVAGGPDVVTQLRDELSPDCRATLCAIDGAVVSDVAAQLRCVPSDATHLVLSAGGNDAISFVDLLDRPAGSFAEVLDTLDRIAEEFEGEYRRMLDRVLDTGLPLILCTIYNGWLPDPTLRRRARTALTVFNDVILRSASSRRVPVVELRQVCTEPGDYANPIEPSVEGGRKIARAIRDAVLGDGR